LSISTDSLRKASCHCEEPRLNRGDVAISSPHSVILSGAKNLIERHHRAGARFRGRSVWVVGLLGDSSSVLLYQIRSAGANNKTNSAMSRREGKITTRRVSIGIINQKIEDNSATTPKEIERERCLNSLLFSDDFNLLLWATCPNTTAVIPISAVVAITIAIMSSFVSPHIMFHLLFLQSCYPFSVLSIT
jgi:hypothetical protein